MEKMEVDPVIGEDWKGEVLKLKEVIIELCLRHRRPQAG